MLECGSGISAAGLTMVGTGKIIDRTEAWVAQLDSVAVPVPASIWLFGSTLSGLVGLRQIKRKHLA